MTKDTGASRDLPLAGVAVDEWVFVVVAADGSSGVMSGHRLVGRTAWYWAVHMRAGFGLLHLAEWEVAVRADAMVVKAPEMWAEHVCEEPLRQWTIGNEAFFSELDDPDDATGGAWGTPTPTAFDIEWYATASPDPLDDINAEGADGGFVQHGVAHGEVEVLGRPAMVYAEAPAQRWRRWGSGPMPPLRLPLGAGMLRAPMRFPGGTIRNWAIAPPGTTTTTVDGPVDPGPVDPGPVDPSPGPASWVQLG